MPKKDELNEFLELEEGLKKLSPHELRELLLINNYKLAMTRAQVSALVEILIKKKVTTYDEIWKLTHENFKDSKI